MSRGSAVAQAQWNHPAKCHTTCTVGSLLFLDVLNCKYACLEEVTTLYSQHIKLNYSLARVVRAVSAKFNGTARGLSWTALREEDSCTTCKFVYKSLVKSLEAAMFYGIQYWAIQILCRIKQCQQSFDTVGSQVSLSTHVTGIKQIIQQDFLSCGT